MSSVQDSRIGLIGPISAGKSSIFATFHEALGQGRHGFPRGANPHIRRTKEETPIEGLSSGALLDHLVFGGLNQAFAKDTDDVLGGKFSATLSDQVVTRHYELSYLDLDKREQKTIQLTITDAAGEHSFPDKPQNNDAAETRLRLFHELSTCDGFVVVVPFANAADGGFVRQLASWLDGLDKIAARQERPGSPRRRRLVIALTRYDALFTDFGSEAFNLAADPKIATTLINRLVSAETYGFTYKNNIARYDNSNEGRFEIAFVPTSSFGFVPGFGCANLDPDVKGDHAVEQIRVNGSPEPFKVDVPQYPGQRLFPFLTADPFIFAATGIKNPFVIPIDRALRRMPYTDWREYGRAAPDAQPRDEAGTVNPKAAAPGAGGGGNGANDSRDKAAGNGSWRRTLADLRNRISKWDIQL